MPSFSKLSKAFRINSFVIKYRRILYKPTLKNIFFAALPLFCYLLCKFMFIMITKWFSFLNERKEISSDIPYTGFEVLLEIYNHIEVFLLVMCALELMIYIISTYHQRKKIHSFFDKGLTIITRKLYQPHEEFQRPKRKMNFSQNLKIQLKVFLLRAISSLLIYAIIFTSINILLGIYSRCEVIKIQKLNQYASQLNKDELFVQNQSNTENLDLLFAYPNLKSQFSNLRNLGYAEFSHLYSGSLLVNNYSRIAISSDLKSAYVVAAGNFWTLYCLDLSNINEFKIFYKYNTLSKAINFISLTSDDKLLILNDNSTNCGLTIFNLTILSNPILIYSPLNCTYTNTFNALSLSKSNNWLVALPNTNRIALINITNPRTIAIQTISFIASNYDKIILTNSELFCIAASATSISIINLQTNFVAGPFLLNMTWLHSLAITSDDNYLIIIDMAFGKGLTIYNISNKTAMPILVSSYNLTSGNYTQVKLSNDTQIAFITDSYCDINFIPCLGNGLFVLNISNRSNPILISTYRQGAKNYSFITFSKDFKTAAIIDNFGYGVIFLNTSNLNSIFRISHFCPLNGKYTTSILSKDSKTLFALENGFVILNMTQGFILVPVGFYSTNAFFYSSFALSSDEKVAYIIDSSSQQSLIILNITDFSNPTLIKSYFISNIIFNSITLSYDNKMAFLSDVKIGGGLYIFDITNYFNIFLLGTYNVSAGIYQSIVSTGDSQVLFIADFSYGNGLIILNISKPSTPSLIGKYTRGAGKYIFLILSTDEQTLFICDYAASKGVVILDVSIKNTPKLLSVYNKNAGYYHSANLLLSGQLLMITDSSCSTPSAVNLLDVSDLKNPVFLQQFKPSNTKFCNPLFTIVSSDSKYGFVQDSKQVPPIQAFSFKINLKTLSSQLSISSNQALFQVTSCIQASYNIFSLQNILNPKLAYTNLGCYLGMKFNQDGTLFYALNTSRFEIFDITVTESPLLVGSFPIFSGVDFSITPDGNTAYILNGISITVLDISNPLSIARLTSHLILSTQFSSITLSKDGKTAFITDESSTLFTNRYGLYIYDTTLRTKITLLSVYNLGAYSYRSVTLSIDEKIAFICDYYYGKGLTILNISNLSSPVLISSYNTDAYYYSSSALLSDENLLLIADDYIGKGLIVLNISNISSPSFVRRYNTSNCKYQSVTVLNGRYAMVSDPNEKYGYVTIDLKSDPNIQQKNTSSNSSNITSPYTKIDITQYLPSLGIQNIVGSIPLQNANGLALSSDGHFLYSITNFGTTITVIDVSVPESPYYVNEVNISGIRAMASDQTSLFLADGTFGFNILDVSDPSNFVSLSTINIPKANFIELDRANSLAYLIDHAGVISIVDYTSKISPTLLISISNPSLRNVNSIKYDSLSKRLICCSDSGIFIYDVSNSLNPMLISSISNIKAGSIDLLSSQKLGFVSNLDGGLIVIDFSIISSPKILTSLGTTQTEQIIVSPSGSAAYLTAGSNFLVYSLQQPQKPQFSGSVPTSSIAHNFLLSLDERYGYVIDGATQLRIIDFFRSPKYILYFEQQRIPLGYSIGNELIVLSPSAQNPSIYDKLSEPYKFVSLSIYNAQFAQDGTLLKAINSLPSWTTFDAERSILIINPGSAQHIADYDLYGIISLQLPDDAFMGVGDITSQTDSLNLIIYLMGKYIDSNKYLMSTFNPTKALYLTPEYVIYEAEIRNKLAEFYMPIMSQFVVISSLSINLHQIQRNISNDTSYIYITTPTSNAITLSIQLGGKNSKFVKVNFQAVASISNGQSLITFTGSRFDVNKSLKQLRVDISENTTYSGNITVSDALNLDANLFVGNILEYLIINQPPFVNIPIQNQIEGITITTGSQFNLNLDKKTFKDPDDLTLEYFLKSVNGEEVPTWIVFKDMVISGIPPNSLGYQLHLLIVASDGYKIASDPFTIKIEISSLYMLQIAAKVIGPILGIIGLFKNASVIYNILWSFKYKSKKTFYLEKSQHINDSVIYPISFISLHLKEARVILDLLKKDFATGNIDGQKKLMEYCSEQSQTINQEKLDVLLLNLYDKAIMNSQKDILPFYCSGSEVNRLKINKIVYIQLILMKLEMPEETSTKLLFDKLKSNWINYVTIKKDSEILRDKDGLPDFHLSQTKIKKDIANANYKMIEKVNQKLLMEGILSHAQMKQNLDISPMKVEILVSERLHYRSMIQTIKDFVTSNLNKSKHPFGSHLGLGINYSLQNYILSFEGQANEEILEKYLIVSLVDESGRIARQFEISKSRRFKSIFPRKFKERELSKIKVQKKSPVILTKEDESSNNSSISELNKSNFETEENIKNSFFKFNIKSETDI